MTKGNENKFLSKNSGKYYMLVGLFIMTIAVTHFALQINFIQKEKLESIETTVEVKNSVQPVIERDSPVNQVIEIQPEQYEVKRVEVITIPEIVKRSPTRRQKAVVPARYNKPVKKKEVRETHAERLRRAERILTGV